MNNLIIPDILYKNISDFCKLNNLLDVEGYMIKLLQLGFNIEKYGVSPIQKSSQKEYFKQEKEAVKKEQEKTEPKVAKQKRVRIIKTDSQNKNNNE